MTQHSMQQRSPLHFAPVFLVRLTTLAASLLAVSGPAFAGDDNCTSGGAPGTYPFRVDTGELAVPPGGQTSVFVLDGLPEPRGYQWPGMRIRASADLGLDSERILLRFVVPGVETEWRTVEFPEEADCASPPNCTNNFYPWDFFNSTAWNGQVEIEIFATPSVSAKTCPDAFIRVELQYLAAMDDDCNNNRRNDACDIADGILQDCDQNGWADVCELARFPERDCNNNGLLDCCDAAAGSRDCNQNGTLDECEIAQDADLDCDRNRFLDRCEIGFGMKPDVDQNGVPDSCDIAAGRLADCNGNGIADVAELIDPNNDLDGDLVLDDCDRPSADINQDGSVGAPDLATLLDRWGTANAACDIDNSGSVGAADLSLLLAAWGPAFLCGNGVLNPGENCCNCPSDAGCGDGFDCYYGACLPCLDGSCPPRSDNCFAFYGVAQTVCYGCTDPSYGTDVIPCYNFNPYDLLCATHLTSPPRARGFAMQLIDVRQPTLAIASLGVIGLLTLPSGLIRRLSSKFRRAK